MRTAANDGSGRATSYVTGRASFADDDRPAHRTHAVFARCPHSHARIESIDVQRVRGTRGVLGVWTGRELDAAIEGALPVDGPAPGSRVASRPALAGDHVRHAGEAVAIIVAETAHVARDAADRVEVDYRPIPAVAEARTAVTPGAPLLHEIAPRNVALAWQTGDADGVATAFATAAHVVEQRIRLPRTAAVAIEPRACTANWESGTGQLTLRAPLQAPHLARLMLSNIFAIPEQRIRILSPDTGGAFGSRISIGPEEVAVCFAAMRVGRPVRWTAVRREAFRTDTQGRDHEMDVAIAFDQDHRILALRIRSLSNAGAYAAPIAFAIPAFMLAASLPGPYSVPVHSAGITLAYTNTVPVGALRGAGRQEACFAIERVLDMAALRFGIDPLELRRRNLDPSTVAGSTARAALEQAASTAVKSRGQGREPEPGMGKTERAGVGYALYVDASAPGPGLAIGTGNASIGLYGRAEVRVHPAGAVTVLTDATDQGQGHDAMFGRIAADVLGIGVHDVTVESSDTALMPASTGTLLGRGAAVSAQAVQQAAEAVLLQAKRIAAHELGVAADAVAFTGSTFRADGDAARSLTLADVARLAYHGADLPAGADRGLFARVTHDPLSWSRTTGAHCAIVNVDAETGNTKLLRYIAVDDVGRSFDEEGVRGMLEGGIAQGIGQVLQERIAYDENGQLLTTSLMDYALPRLDVVPGYDIVPLAGAGEDSRRSEARSAGSAGAIAAPAAIANAILDALAPLGVTHIDPPFTPARIWEAIQQARGGDG